MPNWFKNYIDAFLFNQIENTIPPLDQLTRIAILRDDSIGDLIMMFPLIRGLQQLYPHLEITIITSTINQPLLAQDPSLKKFTIPANINGIALYWRLKRLRRQSFDLLIDPFYRRRSKSLFIYWAIQAQYISGFHKTDKNYVLDEANKPTKALYFDWHKTHFENYRLLLNRLSNQSIEVVHFKPYCSLNLPQSLAVPSQNQLGKTLLFHVHGSTPAKTLTPHLVATFCHEIRQFSSINILLSGSKLNIYLEHLAQTPLKDCVQAINENTSITDLFSVIAVVDSVLTIDTAILHIAALYDKPTVGIYLNDKRSDFPFYTHSECCQRIYAPPLNKLTDDASKQLLKQTLEAVIKQL